MDSSQLRRRRGPGFVTPNACTECRKRRTKCDGQNPCGRCKSLGGIECVYEVPTRQSKDEMREEISQLRSRQRQLEQLLAGMVSQEDSDRILNQLRNGDTLETIRSHIRRSSSASVPVANITTYPRPGDRQAIGLALESAQRAGNLPSTIHPFTGTFQMSSQGQQTEQSELRNQTSHGNNLPNELMNYNHQLDEMNWVSDPLASHPVIGIWHEHPENPEFNSIIQSARSRGQDVILGERSELQNPSKIFTPNPRNESGTMVTSDRELVEHLLALYFCWEYPIFASLSKDHFIEDFSHGIPRYCSPLLLNALLALGCRFSDRPSARADPNDNATTGDHFFAEALKLFEEENDHRVLTTVQALGIMSIREASCGRVSQSIFYSGQSIRLAVEMGLHLDAQNGSDSDDGVEDAEEAVRTATFWGAFSLDEWVFSSAIIHMHILHAELTLKSINFTIKPAILSQVESASWIPYTDDGGPLEQNCVQPSNIRSVYKTFCELSEITHHTLYILYTPGSSVTSKALLDAYSQYIHWYDTVPDALRLGHNFTPAVLFSHLYYHFTILLLFRPFVKFGIIGSDISPRDICNQAARAISAVIKSYSELYTLRRTPSLVPYFVLASTTLHLAEVHTDVTHILNKGQVMQNMVDLKKLSSCHGFAARALDIVRFLGYKWNIDSIFGEMRTEGDAHNLSQTHLIAIDHLRPIIGTAAVIENKEVQPSATIAVPLQGRPLLSIDKKLEECGFMALPGHGP